MNKSLLNIAGLIAFIVGILMCCTIFGAIVGVPLIIGGNKFREYSVMSDYELEVNKDSILIWSVVFLFLCQVSGVLGLVYYVTNEYQRNVTPNTDNNYDRYDELERLNKLYKDKVLSKEEFEKEKERILKK